MPTKTMVKATENTEDKSSKTTRVEIVKTYKLYVGGAFPRTESGRYYTPTNPAGQKLANVCLASRKDVRDAVIAARNAQASWAAKAALNRGQILYRIAEMLEGRKDQFTAELVVQGIEKSAATNEVLVSIDRLIYYAGWADKFQQIFSTVNPVASSHFNFSVPEPMGVVSVIAPTANPLLGIVSAIASAIAGGNTCVVLAPNSQPLSAISFAEVLNSSDVPGGVVNILTGIAAELAPYFASHMDVNALVCGDIDEPLQKMILEKAALNLKRVFFYPHINWEKEEGQSPYFIADTQEIKTTWHPIENIGGAKAGY